MIKLSSKQQLYLSIFLKSPGLQSSAVYKVLAQSGEEVSLVTVKRALSDMAHKGFLTLSGKGRTTSYSISTTGRIFSDINAQEYCAIDPDKRYGKSDYNFDVLPEMPRDIFSEQELRSLKEATHDYKKRATDLPEAIQKKELERFVIELSWKSSKIEGNTYTLLDTEKLILENTEASGHSKKEAVMILNHKQAFTFIHSNAKEFTALTRANLEKLHSIIVKDLSVGLGLRKRPVGVLGSKYRPLDNIHQISEAIDELSKAVSRVSTPYAKALLVLLGISYIQPFEDGNKRTARLMANALLLAHGCAPLSYRSVDEVEYREAMLVFYELNSIISFKKIFVGQYEFAAKNYGVK